MVRSLICLSGCVADVSEIDEADVDGMARPQILHGL
jgi:hypothetical protein